MSLASTLATRPKALAASVHRPPLWLVWAAIGCAFILDGLVVELELAPGDDVLEAVADGEPPEEVLVQAGLGSRPTGVRLAGNWVRALPPSRAAPSPTR